MTLPQLIFFKLQIQLNQSLRTYSGLKQAFLPVFLSSFIKRIHSYADVFLAKISKKSVGKPEFCLSSFVCRTAA